MTDVYSRSYTAPVSEGGWIVDVYDRRWVQERMVTLIEVDSFVPPSTSPDVEQHRVTLAGHGFERVVAYECPTLDEAQAFVRDMVKRLAW